MACRRDQIAARRARYQEELTQGLERLFEPRRKACPWCGSSRLRRRLRVTDYVQRKPGTFVLDQCCRCGHVFQNPRLNAAGLEFYYRDCYDGLGEAVMARLASSPVAMRLYRARARALLALAHPERWLDVGTGHGHFCAVARTVHPSTEFHGLDTCEGVENAVRCGRIAQAHRGTFSHLADGLTAGYDVVSMYHYLEHTTEPRRELAAARTVLRPDGHLVIEVPDPQCAAARVLGRWWGPWLQPQHLHLIPLDNLCTALRQEGFTVVVIDRREPHVPTDLTSAAANMFTSLLPSADAPWLPLRPSLLSRSVRTLSLPVAAPLLAALFAVDLAVAPLARRTGLANAYRVVARRA